MNTSKLFALLLLSFSAMLFSCGSDNEIDDMLENENPELLDLLDVSEEGITTFVVNNLCPILEATASLTTDEIELLFAIKEDEKIACDLAAAFLSLYPAATHFSKIGSAEATHVASIERLFDYYEIEYPALTPKGVFNDEYRQSRYDDLLARGNTLPNAYSAFASLEEGNIQAYSELLTNLNNPNMEIIVSNLLRSSSNHFRVIIRQITILGETYTPSLLDDTTYQELISTTPGQGKQYLQKGKNGQNTNREKRNSEKGNPGKGFGSGQ